MTKTVSLTIIAILGVALAAIFAFQTDYVQGEGWTPVHIQSATTTTVGPDLVKTVFADQVSPTCHSRVISTTDSGIMISFDDVAGFGSTTISGVAGHWQAASTTAVYDSALYGCGLLSAYGYSSTTITISSF